MYYSNDTVIAIVIVQAIIFAVMTGSIAGSKGRSVGQWAFIGAVLSILGVLVAIGIADENVKETNKLLKSQVRLLEEIQAELRTGRRTSTEPPAPVNNNTPGTAA